MVIDGPFAETKEQFLGFYTLECAALDEAVEFARELSEVNPSGGSYEIRPVSVFNPTKVQHDRTRLDQLSHQRGPPAGDGRAAALFP